MVESLSLLFSFFTITTSSTSILPHLRSQTRCYNRLRIFTGDHSWALRDRNIERTIKTHGKHSFNKHGVFLSKEPSTSWGNQSQQSFSLAPLTYLASSISFSSLSSSSWPESSSNSFLINVRYFIHNRVCLHHSFCAAARHQRCKIFLINAKCVQYSASIPPSWVAESSTSRPIECLNGSRVVQCRGEHDNCPSSPFLGPGQHNSLAHTVSIN